MKSRWYHHNTEAAAVLRSVPSRPKNNHPIEPKHYSANKINQSEIMLRLLPPARTHILVLDLRARRLKQPLTRGVSRRTPVTTALPAIDLVDIRAVLNSCDGTNPFPDPADLAVMVLFDRGPHVGVDLDLLLHLLPQLSATRSGELVSQNVVAKLGHADVALAPSGWVHGVETGLLIELLESKAGELFGFGFIVTIVGDAVAAV